MAHPDPHVTDATRRMARPVRRAKPVWLGSLFSLSWLRLPAGERPLSGLRSLSGPPFLPKEPRRRELATVLMLLIVASLMSVAGPTSAGATPGRSPDGQYVDNPIGDIMATPTDPPEPTETNTPDPAMPTPTHSFGPDVTPTPRPVVTRRPAPTPRPPRRFVALGDSLTAWPSTPWPARLDGEDASLTLVNNAGVPGNTTAQMRARLTHDVFAYHPDVLFVLGGTNDLGLGISGSATIANLRAIVVAAKARKIQVILLLVPPDQWSSMAPKIDSLNRAIVTLANSQRVTYVDIHAPLTNSSGTYWAKYTSDGLHFSNLAAQVVANTIRARVRRLGL
jgi:lysophospholipase L1-like esterase